MDVGILKTLPVVGRKARKHAEDTTARAVARTQMLGILLCLLGEMADIGRTFDGQRARIPRVDAEDNDVERLLGLLYLERMQRVIHRRSGTLEVQLTHFPIVCNAQFHQQFVGSQREIIRNDVATFYEGSVHCGRTIDVGDLREQADAEEWQQTIAPVMALLTTFRQFMAQPCQCATRSHEQQRQGDGLGIHPEREDENFGSTRSGQHFQDQSVDMEVVDGVDIAVGYGQNEQESVDNDQHAVGPTLLQSQHGKRQLDEQKWDEKQDGGVREA